MDETGRSQRGRFAVGHAPIAGAGRPKGFAAVARAIMRETSDGLELVQWALAVWRDPKMEHTHAERAAAHAWLSDRALGKAIASVDLVAAVDVQTSMPTLPASWRELPADQRRAWLAQQGLGLALPPGAE